LAAVEDFESLAVERDPFLNQVSVSLGGTGTGESVYISLTSIESFQSQSLRFILEAVISNGRVLGEYFVSLDPSLLDIEQQVVNNFHSSATGQGLALGFASISVSETDTLWSIAARVRPSLSVTTQQTMLAIVELNPNAFINNNINRMLAGEVLRIPTLIQIQSFNADNAISEVRLQNQEVSGEELGALLSANIDLDRRIEDLENRLAISLEEASRAENQRLELESRLAELELQIGSEREAISVQDVRLAQLQAQIAEDMLQDAVVISANEGEGLLRNSLLTDIRDFVSVHSVLIFGAIMAVFMLILFLLRPNKAKNVQSGAGLKGEIEFSTTPNLEDSTLISAGRDSAEDNGRIALSLEEEDESNTAVDRQISDPDINISLNNSEIEPKIREGNLEGRVLEEQIMEFEATDDDPGEEFADLGFLPEGGGEQVDSIEGVEEVFHISEEETATKLELSYAYQKMGDLQGAIEILQEVIQEGNPEQIREAKDLIISFEKSKS
jgi:FimV-like protein